MKPGTAIINLTLVISIVLCSASFSQTPTPTPDPCAGCPSPTSIGCTVNYPACVACWEACGRPIATPTPTPTVTPTATATPTPTPTPQPGCNAPDCDLTSTAAATVYLVAVFAHEDPARPGTRYTYQTLPQTLVPGMVARPGPYEACPIGFEWFHVPPVFPTEQELLPAKICGDTGRVFPFIFDDGFETGNTTRWSTVF